MSAESKKAVDALVEEGDIAADYLEQLLDIADFDGDLDMVVAGDRASVAIIAEDEFSRRQLNHLVGKDGEVLDALQELTRLAVQAKTGERSRVMLDIVEFRKQKRAAFMLKAQDVIAEVKASGKAVHLEPMNPFERKIVHDAVAEAGLTSASEGAEKQRHVVIHPA